MVLRCIVGGGDFWFMIVLGKNKTNQKNRDNFKKLNLDVVSFLLFFVLYGGCMRLVIAVFLCVVDVLLKQPFLSLILCGCCVFCFVYKCYAEYFLVMILYSLCLFLV